MSGSLPAAAATRCPSCRRRASATKKESSSVPPPDRPGMMKMIEDMPPALSSMWRALKRAHQAEPRLLRVSFVLAMLAALPDALLALWMKLMADGVVHHNRGLAIRAGIGLRVSAVGTSSLKV